MASTFKVQYSANATPIEETQLTDTDNTTTAVHSSIDKSIGGSKLLSCGTTSTQVAYKDYTTTTGYIALSEASIFNSGSIQSDFLMVKIREAANTGTPDCTVSLDTGSTAHIVLSGIGDVCLLPLGGLTGAVIKLKSSGATATAKVDILLGEVE